MKHRLVYVELKSGFAGNGPAWIQLAQTSKSGATIYTNGKALKSLKGSGINANYFDIETGEQYWVSGVKKNTQDRHWAGSGKVEIDEDAIRAYLSETGIHDLPSNLIRAQLQPGVQTHLHHQMENDSPSESDVVPLV